MKRMHLKRKRNIKIRLSNKIILIIIILIVAIIFVLKLFNDKSLPLLMKYSEVETNRIATLILNSTITDEITNNYDMDKLFITTKDNEGDIISIDFNSIMVNEILSNTSRIAELNLKELKDNKNYSIKDGVVFELPSGIIFNNTILNNVLPKIPVKLELIGSIFSKIDTSVKSYGINNSLIEVYVSISVDLRILLPFTSKTTSITTKIPIAIKAIQGKIPSYYLGGYLGTPSLTTNVE